MKHTLSFKILLVLAAIGITHGQTGLNVEQFKVEAIEVLGVDSPEWFNRAQTGEVEIHDISSVYMKASPDEKWILMGTEVHGLDVENYKLYLISTENPKLIPLVDQALDATFSPNSKYLFVSTGPNPIIYDLASLHGVVITTISSGLEHFTCWVHDWSEDSKTLTIHQQARFDDPSNPLGWKIVLE